MQENQPFMFLVLHAVFMVAQMISSCKWLSIIARFELGADLDWRIIDGRSELGSAAMS